MRRAGALGVAGLAVLVLAAGLRGARDVPEGEVRLTAPGAPWALAAPLVAHAAGRIDGRLATNSREAFEASCRAGYRAIEVDFAETSDGHVVARHDWGAGTNRILGQASPRAPGQPWTFAEAMAQPIHGRYHTLDPDALFEAMARYPGVHLVTDTKATDPVASIRIFRVLAAAARARDPALLDRVVPQLYNEAMAPAIRSVHPFRAWILTLYQLRASEDEVLAICRRQGVGTVTLPPHRARPAFLARLAEAGLATYVHTINRPGAMAAWRCAGVYGFYTDTVPVGGDPPCPEALRPAGLRVSGR